MAVAATVVGGLVGMGTKIAGGVMQKREADRQAIELEKEALDLDERTAIRKKRLKREGRQFLGDQTAAIAASGVEVSGSPLAGLVESQQSVREELGDIDRNHQSERRALLTGAQRYRRQGRQALASGVLGAVSSGASSGVSAARAGGLI